jgi:hypothetical protein
MHYYYLYKSLKILYPRPTLQIRMQTADITDKRVHISNTCKVGKKLGVSLPLLTCSPLA